MACSLRLFLLIFAYLNLIATAVCSALGIGSYILFVHNLLSDGSKSDLLFLVIDGIILGSVCAFVALFFAIYLLYGLIKYKITYIFSYFVYGVAVIITSVIAQIIFICTTYGFDVPDYIGHSSLVLVYIIYITILCLIYKRFKQLLPSEDNDNEQNRSQNHITKSKLELSSFIYGICNILTSIAALFLGLVFVFTKATVSEYLFIDHEGKKNYGSEDFIAIIDVVMPGLLVVSSIAGIIFSVCLVYGISKFQKNIHLLKAHFVYGMAMLIVTGSLFVLWIPISVYLQGSDAYFMLLLLLSIINFAAVFVVRQTYIELESSRSPVEIPLFQNKQRYSNL